MRTSRTHGFIALVLRIRDEKNNSYFPGATIVLTKFDTS